ncbi:MAG: hypothetical protein UH241_04735 [Acutalibacteraceae bacterium]|nr:hypothetical protein [Acutalibacteraceae bacterium]
MKEFKVGLIKGRHELPVSEYIFSNELNFPLDYRELDKIVANFIEKNIEIETASGFAINSVSEGGSDHLYYVSKKRLVVYVTGLTACTASVIKICMHNGVHLTLMHYDPVTQEYMPQIIF